MWLPTNGTMSFFSAETIEQMFTATQDFDLWPQAALHTQWPGVRFMVNCAKGIANVSL